MAMNAARIRFSALFAALALTMAAAADAPDPIDSVNVFVGADNNGNTVPGASVPFGFVNFGPDTLRGSTNGYDSRSPLTGFSLTHVSGTGGNSKYGNFRVTPTIGPIDPRAPGFGRSEESGAPGYYATRIGTGDNAIKVELTAARMVGLVRFTFPSSFQSNVLIDATSAIQLMGAGPKATAAEVHLIDRRTFAGWAAFTGGWNTAPLKLYFAASFDRVPQSIGGFAATRGSLSVQPGTAVSGGDQRTDPSAKIGGYARFDTTRNHTVQMKVAVSFVSEEQARVNLDSIAGFDFDTQRQAATALWQDALARIAVEGGSEAVRRNFYSALYRSHTMPHDLTGENVWWKSGKPHYEDFYTLWDTFRTLHPLLTLIQPQRQRDMIVSLLDTYSHTGWLPDARIAGANGMTQGGSNGDVVIADAIVKNLGGFDRDLAYEALVKNADVDSANPLNEGRSLKSYLRHGYMTLDETRSASRTLEYAYDDFAIAEVATALGKADDAARYWRRSGAWQLLWNDSLKCIRPRYADGAWLTPFDCNHLYPDNATAWWDAPFYEGSSAQYSTYVPHDVAGLIAKLGGERDFVLWLDRLFERRPSEGGYDHGNEPDFLAAYLYLHAGRADRTADRVRAILENQYRPVRDGLPGNDDAGAMSSWYVWSAIGLFPNAGQPFYYISSPLFSRSRIQLEQGRVFEISAPHASTERRYVVGARLNGHPIDRAWISHDELVKGGVLELDMSDRPGAWASHFVPPPNRYHPDPAQQR
jgi:predicted alpha-1,2-mannosidase